VTTPLALTILELRDMMRYTLGMYWISTIIESVLLVWLAEDVLTAGITNQIIICIIVDQFRETALVNVLEPTGVV